MFFRRLDEVNMMKKTLSLILFFSMTLSLFAQTSKIKFIKGNIADKTAAVREADNSDSQWISEQAVSFCLDLLLLPFFHILQKS